MFLGRYEQGETVKIIVCAHKFETGEELAGVLTGYYIKDGSAPASKVDLSFSVFNSETGAYEDEVDTSSLSEGVYHVFVEGTIDTVNTNICLKFEVRTAKWLFGLF